MLRPDGSSARGTDGSCFSLGDKAVRVLGHPAGYFAVRALCWCALFIVVFAPLAARRYKRG